MKKFRKTKLFLCSTLIGALAFGGIAFAGSGLTRGTQTIYGDKTFQNKTTFEGDITINGSLLGLDENRTVYYVSSVTGADSVGNYGTTWKKPFATVEYATNQCTGGEAIVLLHNHAETIAAADGWDLDVAGVTVIGLGDGAYMPEFTFSATESEIVIGAANVTIENVRLIAGISSITMGISVEADGDNFTLRNCVFPKPTTNSWEFLDAIDVADGANDIRIEGCEYYNDEGGAAPNHFIDAGNGTAGPERLQVVNCIIKGDFAVSAIWSDEPCDEAFIAYNTIINHTTGQHCIEFTDTGTGAIIGNKLYGDTEGAILDSGSMYTHGNTYSTAIDLDGIPVWVIDNGLNHIMALDGATQVYPENAVDDSVLAKLLSKSDPADISDYNNATDSLEALADQIIAIDANVDTIEEASEPAYDHPNYIALSVDLTNATWNTAAAHEILTVTGNVRLRIMVECTETLTDGADGATLTLGDEITAAGMIASTSAAGAGAANQLDAGEFWIDATPADVSPVALSSAILDFVVLQGADVGYTIGGEALTDGTLIFHMWWTALDSTGAAVVGAGGAL